MNRKIKFRFWDKQEKMFWDDPQELNHFVFNYGRNYSDNGKDEDRIIFAGQYTGLKDKNGREVYEGDILKDQSDGLHEIQWNNNDSFFSAKAISRVIGWGYVTDWEIIGNVFENSELLDKPQTLNDMERQAEEISFKQFYNEQGDFSICFCINGEEMIVSSEKSELKAKEAVRRLNEHIDCYSSQPVVKQLSDEEISEIVRKERARVNPDKQYLMSPSYYSGLIDGLKVCRDLLCSKDEEQTKGK